MHRSVIALLVFCSTSALADDGFYLSLNSAFHPQADSQTSDTLDPFWETGVGLGYKEPWSEAWNLNYELGIATAKAEYSGAGDERTHSVYTRVLFEYNQLSDSVKPFAGAGLQKTYASIGNQMELKKSVGFNFYPAQQDYAISFMVSHSN